MRILFISPFLYRYLRGIERFTVDLANALAKQSVKVDLLTWSGPLSWAWGGLYPGVTCHKLPTPRYYSAFFASLMYPLAIARLKPDIINLFFTWHGEEWAASFFLGRIPINLILHSPAAQVPHRYRLLQTSQIAIRSNAITSVSQFVADGVTEWLGRNSNIITSGVDVNRFCAAPEKTTLRTELRIQEDALVLLTVAALERRKGIHEAIDALSHIISQVPNLLYLIVGDGLERASLELKVKQLGLSSHVRFIGNVSDPVPFYQLADVFIFLSKGEASPLALLEAMSCGLPVVAATEPPLTEILSVHNSFLVNQLNPQAIADAVINLADTATRIRFGQWSRQVAIEQYDWKQIAAEYIALFHTIKN